MKFKMFLILEQGESKQQFAQELEKKLQFIAPSLSGSIKCEKYWTEEGKCGEFLIDGEEFQKQIAKMVEHHITSKGSELFNSVNRLHKKLLEIERNRKSKELLRFHFERIRQR